MENSLLLKIMKKQIKSKIKRNIDNQYNLYKLVKIIIKTINENKIKIILNNKRHL